MPATLPRQARWDFSLAGAPLAFADCPSWPVLAARQARWRLRHGRRWQPKGSPLHRRPSTFLASRPQRPPLDQHAHGSFPRFLEIRLTEPEHPCFLQPRFKHPIA
jgi:hypothetical protein